MFCFVLFCCHVKNNNKKKFTSTNSLHFFTSSLLFQICSKKKQFEITIFTVSLLSFFFKKKIHLDRYEYFYIYLYIIPLPPPTITPPTVSHQNIITPMIGTSSHTHHIIPYPSIYHTHHIIPYPSYPHNLSLRYCYLSHTHTHPPPCTYLTPPIPILLTPPIEKKVQSDIPRFSQRYSKKPETSRTVHVFFTQKNIILEISFFWWKLKEIPKLVTLDTMQKYLETSLTVHVF